MQLHYDGSLDIAVGKSRKETNWRNKEMLWSDLLDKLSITHRTTETYAEYLAAKKPRQDEIKDIGGFVGGSLSGGRRKSGAVTTRQLLTLDMDFCKSNPWDDFTLLYHNAACVYSTHKHSPDAPRLRLVIPLSRPVFADEYEAIGRRIAGMVDIELFDPTTFQPERLMYWPSTAKDAEFFFEYQDGPWLDADAVLGEYADWRDTSLWPVSSKVDKLMQRSIQKQGDPLEKPGIVGAFCRTYTISEVIDTYLSDVYEACDQEGRYTYIHGSTAAGLVVYDDKYAYSHHGTDPATGKLCNAFDLVRVHKFGLKDEDSKDDTPSNKLPSYVAMCEFATKDKHVRQQIGIERVEQAKADFDLELPEGITTADQDWMQELEADRKGNLTSSHANMKLILENDPLLKGVFGFDEFQQRKVLLRNLPWRRVDEGSKYLRDEDEQNLVIYLSNTYNILNRANMKEVLDTHIYANAFHPVRNYLNGLVWDKQSRVDRFFIDYLGAEDTPYIRAVTRKALCAAVARVFVPGIKFDYVLTLVGPEGIMKSTSFSKLGKDWFSDSFSFSMLHSKEAYEQLQGAWLIEIPELSGMRKAEVEGAKHFLSKRQDSYRQAYARNLTTIKRQCVFFGTTNNWNFLREANGNRRFWPVVTHVTQPYKDIIKDLDDLEIDQIWAEAKHLWRAGEPLFLSKDIEAMAKEAQQAHTEKDDRAGAVLRYLDMLLPDNWDNMSVFERRAYIQDDSELKAVGVNPRMRVSVAEIWCEVLGGQMKEMTTQNTKWLHQLLQDHKEWERMNSKGYVGSYGKQTLYQRLEAFGQTKA